MQRDLRIMASSERATLTEYMQKIIDYRKSGLSLNHIVGCPLDCAYCVRHFWGNFDMKEPQALVSDEEAVEALLQHKYFTQDKTPVQIFNRATDPFLAPVKEHTHRVLELLDAVGMRNLIILITRFRVEREDIERLNALRNLRVTLLFTYSGIDDKKIEPIRREITLDTIKTAYKFKRSLRTVLYWRPIVPGWNDDLETIRHVIGISRMTDAIAFTGLFYRPEQKTHFETEDILVPYGSPQRRKILPLDVEQKILREHKRAGCTVPIFRKTSCAVCYLHNEPDYNGHYGIPNLCEICPLNQQALCSQYHAAPTQREFQDLLDLHDYSTSFTIEDGHVWTEGLGEERRYHLQHSLGFQVWERSYPHLPNQHGRAPVGYDDLLHETPSGSKAQVEPSCD